MDGRLRQYNQYAHCQSDSGKRHGMQLCKRKAQLTAHRHKAHIDTGEKHHQTHISKGNAQTDFPQPLVRKPQEGELTDQEEDHNQSKRNRNFLGGMSRSMQKCPKNIDANRIIRHIVGHLALGKNTQNQHRQNRPYRTQRH